MRTEREMFDRILGFAEADARVRAVYMNGSRANPNAPRDRYMDFDIVYVVTELPTFTASDAWLDVFGEKLIVQKPETMRYPEGTGFFNWLILFTDGNRIDLTLIPVEKPELVDRDSATVVLLDKDGRLPAFPPASDSDYITRPPSELFYTSCCNNFFWCMQNVAKGIVRDELPYAMGMYHYILDTELTDMIRWYIGSQNGFSVAPGKMGKYFRRFLSPELYALYLEVFPTAAYESMWNAVFTACKLFRTLAVQVGASLGFAYNERDDAGIMTYLRMLRDGTL